MQAATPKMADMESLLLTLIEKEIPEGRQALRDGHENLAKVAAYCEQKYLDTNNRFKSGPDRDKVLEETRAVLDETKQFATQSLASVAYQINSLALNMLSLLDQQALKLQDMESRINHIGETVNIHKEKVARREIGVLATNKLTGRTHRIIAPAEQEKAKRYNRKQTDYTLLDDFGHGVKTGDRPELRRRTSSRKAKSPAPAGNEGSLRQRMPGGGTSRRPPLTVKPPPPPVPPPMPPSVPPGMASEPPPPPVSSVAMPPMAPSVPISMTMAPPPPLQTSFPGASSPPPPPGVPGVPAPPPPPVLGGGPVPAPPPPPALSLPLGANLPPPDVIPPSDLGAGAGAYESMADVMSPLPPPPPSAEDFYRSPSSLPMPAPPEDLYETPPAAMMVPPPPPISQEDWVPQVYLEKVVALYDYEQQREDELTFSEGATVYVIKKNDDGWFEGVMQGGATGLFPGNYVEVCL